jgi:hypothetical protein
MHPGPDSHRDIPVGIKFLTSFLKFQCQESFMCRGAAASRVLRPNGIVARPISTSTSLKYFKAMRRIIPGVNGDLMLLSKSSPDAAPYRVACGKRACHVHTLDFARIKVRKKIKLHVIFFIKVQIVDLRCGIRAL